MMKKKSGNAFAAALQPYCRATAWINKGFPAG
jgi:hypothetical protein